MCQCGMSKDELLGKFRRFLMHQGDDVSAEVLADCWNALAKENNWEDRLKAYDLSDKQMYREQIKLKETKHERK